MSSPRAAIVGATGAVGRDLLEVLARRRFPLRDLRLFASPRSAGSTLAFGGEALPVEALGERSFEGVDLAWFAAGAEVARAHAPRAVEAGAVVIDNSSAFRGRPDVPLVVPEVNPAALRSHVGLVANPNCSTILLVLALWPLHRAAGLRSVAVTTFQAASGAGRRGLEELHEGVRATVAGRDPEFCATFGHPLAFNAIPQVGPFGPEGYTAEEDKMRAETREILGLPDLPLEATCVRVPVERCHSEAVSVRLERPLTVGEARRLFEESEGVDLVDAPGERSYPMPLRRARRDEVGVGRLRVSRLFESGLAFWISGDQLRKGASLNAVQIAERM